MTLQTPLLVGRHEGDHYHFLNHLMTTKVSSSDSDGALTAMEFVGPKGFGPPLHRHDVEDELFYVVEGEVWFGCGEAEAAHREGSTVWLPRGLAHTLQILSDEARIFQVTLPGQFERFVAALGSPIPNTTLPEPIEIDPEQVAQIAAKHDIQILGPPPNPIAD